MTTLVSRRLYYSAAPGFLYQIIAAKHDLKLYKLFSLATFNKSLLNLRQISFLNAQNARFAKRVAFFHPLTTVCPAVRLEENLFSNGPPDIQRLANWNITISLTQPQLAKQNNVKVAVIKALLV